MRDLIIVDVETTGLRLGRHIPIEVAAVNMTTGAELYFVPALPKGALDDADGQALQINRYFERGVYAKVSSDEATADHYATLQEWLKGNTLGGSNPRFDGDMLTRAFHNSGCGLPWTQMRPEPWHHRLADLAAYASPAMNLPPWALPGLDKVCDFLKVKNEVAHSALSDAHATAECFRKLIEQYIGVPLEAMK